MLSDNYEKTDKKETSEITNNIKTDINEFEMNHGIEEGEEENSNNSIIQNISSIPAMPVFSGLPKMPVFVPPMPIFSAPKNILSSQVEVEVDNGGDGDGDGEYEVEVDVEKNGNNHAPFPSFSAVGENTEMEQKQKKVSFRFLFFIVSNIFGVILQFNCNIVY